MPIKLITGQPGNGKTLYAVKLIIEAQKTGRPIYSNINGLNLDGVAPIPINDRGELDWTLTEKGVGEKGIIGALIVYDETQKLPYFAYKSKEKLSTNPLITDLEDHRHHSYDFIFITQSPKFLHLHLLELVNEHYHVKRPMNKSRAEIHLHRKACMLPETEAAEKRAEDIFKFDYPPELFKVYKSTEIVTNGKTRIPKYMKKLVFIIGFCVLGILYATGFTDNFMFNKLKSLVGLGSPVAEVKHVDETKENEKPSNSFFDKASPSTANDADLSSLCRQAVNLDKPECIKWFDDLSKNNASVSSKGVVTVSYDPSKPYDFDYKPEVQPTDFPRMSGVIKLATGKLMAIDQQGNYMISISQSDCQKWLSGYRPFNYFENKNNDQSNLQASSNIQTPI